ncbi:putative toxin-antitoxin system toxin component, PIN family [Candidatus Pacearchaeota archaeon CG10_big_fil_rev_8_21_14_0_10_32_14]|nr:MAG: putative toxin-antitoxin system toxin component, PIN family [Candidatus Pacearchaeota archaeon CG10_big_fil_rev_8_21_14_0_10_32_14]
MRVILDTNVFISGIFWEGNYCSQIIDLWMKGKFELVVSKDTLDELVKTLKSFKIPLKIDLIEDWRKLLIENSICIETSHKLNVIKEDPDDDKFLETAIEGKAEIIVSQDNHLLRLKEFQGIKIITPKEFLDVVGDSI